MEREIYGRVLVPVVPVPKAAKTMRSLMVPPTV